MAKQRTTSLFVGTPVIGRSGMTWHHCDRCGVLCRIRDGNEAVCGVCVTKKAPNRGYPIVSPKCLGDKEILGDMV